MTTLLGDAICNIEEEEYWEACQHALKSLYEARRANDEDEERGKATGDDDSYSDSESNNSEDYDSQFSGNDWGEPPSEREYEDDGLYYEDYDNDVDYYDEDIEDDEANRWSDIDSDKYRLKNVLKVAGKEMGEANNIDYGCLLDWSCIIDVSSKSGP